ncbi:MAG: DUF4154 domain-containing protein [Ignavibacteria bacterium]|nr:DUF4154 domain-containing protein [Ignavibacteria bacterium]
MNSIYLKRILLFFIAALVVCSNDLSSQDIAVPVELQVSLFTKIVSFDRKFHERAGKEMVIGVVYQNTFRNSLVVKEQFCSLLENISEGKISGILFRYVPIDFSEKSNLLQTVESESIDVLYICPLRTVELASIITVSQTHHALTFTGVPEYVERGISTGVGLKGNKPQILINLPASKAEGIEYTSQLLKLAKIFTTPYLDE